jgi:ABC-type multidrug transport system fused ATPase/permease subunit
MSNRKDDAFYLYFIIRSILMGLLGALIFSIIIWLLNTTNLFYVLCISAGSFFIVMFLTRIFDNQIRNLVDKILKRLDEWPSARDFLLKHF